MLFKDIAIVDEHYNYKKNKYVIVEGDRILAIGDNMPKNYTGEVYEGKNKILAPGFYNAHCHAPMVLMRGHGEGLPLQKWLNDKIFPFEAKLTDEDIYHGSMLGIAEMIASGCVSFTEMYFNIENTCKAVNEAGIKANVSYGFLSYADSPNGIEKSAQGMAHTKTAIQYMQDTGGRVICDIGIHGEYTSSAPLVTDLVELATANNLGMHLHLSETKAEHMEAIGRRGATPAKYFQRLGVFSRPTNAAHCVWLDDGDFEILAENKVSIAHCPSSNLKLGSGVANVKKMLKEGINVAIGTDGAASNNNLNMLEEVTLAAIVQKGFNKDSAFLSNQEVFAMACKNGAAAQGRQDCGTIKVNNKADLVVYNTDTPHMQPVIDGTSNILYSAQSSDIVLTMVDGRVVYKNGEYKTIDIEKTMFNVDQIVASKLGDL